MDELHEKVKKALEQTFADLQDYLEEHGGRVSGYVVSSAFDELDDAARQKRLWEVLKKELAAEELLHVGPIATLGQQESAFPFTD